MRLSTFIIFFVFSVALFACGGGSSDSGILIEGILDEGAGAEHLAATARHSAGERIEGVKICALGECSTTDGQGQWGFVADPGFGGGEVVFTIQGHGIDAQALAYIPQQGANEVFIHFRHENGTVIVHHMLVDGVHSEEHHDNQHY